MIGFPRFFLHFTGSCSEARVKFWVSLYVCFFFLPWNSFLFCMRQKTQVQTFLTYTAIDTPPSTKNSGGSADVQPVHLYYLSCYVTNGGHSCLICVGQIGTVQMDFLRTERSTEYIWRFVRGLNSLHHKEMRDAVTLTAHFSSLRRQSDSDNVSAITDPLNFESQTHAKRRCED